MQKCQVGEVTPLTNAAVAAVLRTVVILQRISRSRLSISNSQQTRDVLRARTDTQIVSTMTMASGRIW
jgi:hypothetical protein